MAGSPARVRFRALGGWELCQATGLPLHPCFQPARDKAVRKAGWSQVWAECSEPGFNQWPAVRPGDSGSVFLGSLFSQLVLGALRPGPHAPADSPPSLPWSLQAVSSIELLTPEVNSKQACVQLWHFNIYKMEGKMPPMSYHVDVVMEESDKIIIWKNTRMLSLLFKVW